MIEVYSSWAGPCKAIQSTLKRIYFDAGDRPLKMFTVCGACSCLGCRPLCIDGSTGAMLTTVKTFTLRVLRQLDAEKVAGFEEYRGKCQPVYLFYKVCAQPHRA